MPSNSLNIWTTDRAKKLDELVVAHRAVGGNKRGRRYGTQALNQAYVVILAGHFQEFCRDLHSESAAYLVAALHPAGVGRVLGGALVSGRALDRRNANATSIGEDFDRLGLSFWREVDATDARVAKWRERLGELNEWRNAIAHQSFAKFARAGIRPVVFLSEVEGWRASCRSLARSFDRVMGIHLGRMVGTPPW